MSASEQIQGREWDRFVVMTCEVPVFYYAAQANILLQKGEYTDGMIEVKRKADVPALIDQMLVAGYVQANESIAMQYWLGKPVEVKTAVYERA